MIVQNMYPNEDLHGLKEKRICFSYDLLEWTLCSSGNKKKRDKYLELFKENLIKKGFKSLDFYDVYKIIYEVDTGCYFGKIHSSSGPDPFEKIEVSADSGIDFTFQKMDEDENINEKIKSLEKRINALENRLEKLENK